MAAEKKDEKKELRKSNFIEEKFSAEDKVAK